MSSNNFLFEDIFTVTDINPPIALKEAKEAQQASKPPFEKVNRIIAKSTTYDAKLTLDINNQIYPVKRGDTQQLAIASTLSPDGKPDDGTYRPLQLPGVLATFQYIMHGRIFDYDVSTEKNTVSISASFGGLLMLLEANPAHLSKLSIDQRIYLLMKAT